MVRRTYLSAYIGLHACLRTSSLGDHSKAFVNAHYTDHTDMTVESVVLDGDYNETVGSNKQQFLQECTMLLSSKGTRAVECVDVRPGSIVVDLAGDKHAVTAAAYKTKIKGLSLPSFPKLVAEGVTTIFLALWVVCLFFFCIDSLQKVLSMQTFLSRGIPFVLCFMRQ